MAEPPSDLVSLYPDLAPVAAALRGMRRVIVVAHEKPDGDAVGSALALARALRGLGKEVFLTGFEAMADIYYFLFKPGESCRATRDLLGKADGLVAVDCADQSRLAAFAGEDLSGLKTVNVDHHVTNDRFAEVNWVAGDVSSTGEMVYFLTRHLGVPLTMELAEPLWTAIVTDTGNFCFSNTLPQTLRVAAELLAAGVDCNRAYRKLRENKKLKDVFLMRRALERLELCAEGRLGIITLRREDFAEFSSGLYGLQDPVNLALMVDSAVAAAFICEVPREDKIKVSLRAYEPYDVAKLARQFGGGGHARAAGFSFAGLTLADAKGRTIAAMEKMLRTTPGG
ncbi:MAG: bifunctional oligoribonuclease/PAP phosphatase NrnA [Planctomycetes bacterium]|nr:bifunctional oligoribonuclease/PAP phosphatase NrnA [Planctomycetota bacterium]